MHQYIIKVQQITPKIMTIINNNSWLKLTSIITITIINFFALQIEYDNSIANTSLMPSSVIPTISHSLTSVINNTKLLEITYRRHMLTLHYLIQIMQNFCPTNLLLFQPF